MRDRDVNSGVVREGRVGGCGEVGEGCCKGKGGQG